MSDLSVSVQTWLVRGSDIAVGKRVRVLVGVYAGTEATVKGIAPVKYGWYVEGLDGWGLGYFAPHELEPLEAS
jgi:hypothetical protein